MAITTAANQILARNRHMAEVPEQYWELLEQYRDILVRDAQFVVGKREDAEDVVQETFCEAIKSPEKLQQADSIKAWLLHINRCNAMDRVRHTRRDSQRKIRMQQEDPQVSVTTGGFSGLETSDFVKKAVEALPSKMRAVVALHYFEHLTYKEIAERLKMPQGTVGRLLYEASKQLYGKLEIHVDRRPSEGTETPPANSNEPKE